MGKKVLIIDDEKLIVKATSLVVRLAGYDVFSANNGEDGLEKAKEIHPDIILLDIMMPGMDGWQVLEKLKLNSDLNQVPVIVFTAKEYIRGKEKSISAGAVDYIMKPFEPEELLSAIKKAINDSYVNQGG